MIFLIQSLFPNHGAIGANAGMLSRLVKCAALGTKIIQVKIIVLSALVAPDLSHENPLLYQLSPLYHNFRHMERKFTSDSPEKEFMYAVYEKHNTAEHVKIFSAARCSGPVLQSARKD